jgi:hypothetical protein
VSDLPVACTLAPATLKTRRDGLLRELVRRADAREERPDGYRFRVAPAADVLAFIAGVIEAERRCCRFLRFHLTVDPDEGPIHLELTGPSGTREFLSALFDE